MLLGNSRKCQLDDIGAKCAAIDTANSQRRKKGTILHNESIEKMRGSLPWAWKNKRDRWKLRMVALFTGILVIDLDVVHCI